MFKYVSPETGKEKTIDLNAQACIQARFVEKMSWNNIANTGEHQDKLAREVRFGSACNTRNLNDARQSDEWEKEVHRFADEGGHDAKAVLHVAVPRQRANTVPSPAPKLEDVDTEPLQEEIAPQPAILEVVSPASKWVIDTHGDSVNLDHASSVNVGEDSVYAQIGDEVRELYRGEHLREYYTWITTEVLNVCDFEWEVDEEDAEVDEPTAYDAEYEWDEDEE